MTPAAHVSSYWQERLDEMACTGHLGGFERIAHGHLGAEGLFRLELLSYWSWWITYPRFWEVYRDAVRVTRMVSGTPDCYTFRTAAVLTTLEHAWRHLGPPHALLCIGDGQGLLSALLRLRHSCDLLCLDLPEMLAIQHAFHQRLGLSPLTYLTPDRLDAIGRPSWVVSISCFQELTQEMIRHYFAKFHVWQSWVYLVSRQEKRLPDGVVTTFNEYPWHPIAAEVFHRPCAYYTHHFDARFPYYHKKQHLVQERMAKLASTCG